VGTTGRAARALRTSLLALLVAALGCRHAVPPGVTEVQLWAMGREGEVVDRMLPGLAARHPELRVRVQQIPWSAAHEKLLTAYVGGALPDVFQAGNTWLPELVALGAIEPLDARLAASPALARDDWFPGILDTNVIDGVTWGVPWYVDTRVLFYRTDLLADAGVAAPPRTWAAWTDAMARVAAHGTAGSHAILLPLREWQVPVILALQSGADLLRDGDRFGDFRSPAFRRAFEFYLDLFRRGLAPRAGDAEVTNVYQDFARGWFAFWVTGPWNLGELAARLPAALQDRWATAPLPAPGDGWPGVSLAGGASLVLARASSRKDAAWTVVEYLSETAQQAEFHRLTGDLPARPSAWRAAGLPDAPRARAFWVQLQSVRSTPKIPEWERIADEVARWAEAAVRGETTVDEALGTLDRDVDAILEKRRWLLDSVR
jgi:multiple sugar transport system substrate-binding protein